VDATFGRGGHSRLILERLGPRGRLIGMDRIRRRSLLPGRYATRALRRSTRASANCRQRFAALHAGGADGVLFDLGVSSPQLDDPRRGFSFRVDALGHAHGPDAG